MDPRPTVTECPHCGWQVMPSDPLSACQQCQKPFYTERQAAELAPKLAAPRDRSEMISTAIVGPPQQGERSDG
jgi:hypothetical protein